MDLAISDKDNFEEGLDFLPDILKLAEVPVIVVTFDDRWETFHTAVEAGVDGFLFKNKYQGSRWHQYLERAIKLLPRTVSKPLKTFPTPYDVIFEQLASFESAGIKTPILLQGGSGIEKKWLLDKFIENTYMGHPICQIDLNWLEPHEIFEALESSAPNHIVVWTGIDQTDYESRRLVQSLFEERAYENNHRWIFLSDRVLAELAEAHFPMSLRKYLQFFSITFPILSGNRTLIRDWIDILISIQLVGPRASYFYERPVATIFQPGILERFQSFYWPGHVRELRNSLRVALANAEREGLAQVDFSCLPVRLQRILPLTTSDQAFTVHRKLSIAQDAIHQAIADLTQALQDLGQVSQVEQWDEQQQQAYEELKLIGSALNESSLNLAEAAQQLKYKNRQEMENRLRQIYIDFPEFFKAEKFFMILFKNVFKSINVFLYSDNRNKRVRKIHRELLTQLSVQESIYHLDLENNFEFKPGEKEQVLNRRLNKAHIIIPLLCSNLATDEKVLELIKRQQENRLATIIPIFAQDFDMEAIDWISKLHYLPNPGERAIDSYSSRERPTIYKNISKDIAKVFDQYHLHKKSRSK